MRLKTRLRLNSLVTLVTVFLAVLTLVWSLREAETASGNATLVSEMERAAFERTVLRDEYLLHQEKRARIQWQAKSDELTGLMTTAVKELTEPSDRALLETIRAEIDGTTDIFTRLVEIREGGKRVDGEALSSPEGEKRLVGRILARASILRDTIHKLGESAQKKAAAAHQRSVLLVVLLMVALVVATIGNSALINILLAKRIATLSGRHRDHGGGQPGPSYRPDGQ
ncbi:MAG: hypothetical protein AB9873_14355 [Syntrophobacteraceae bacterium]